MKNLKKYLIRQNPYALKFLIKISGIVKKYYCFIHEKSISTYPHYLCPLHPNIQF